MRKVKTEEAVGLTLCHDVTEMRDGFKGAAFKRGHVIRQEDVEKLLDIGKKHIFIWEENADEIHEEECAAMLSEMLAAEGTHYTPVSEGKVVMIADRKGQFRVDTDNLYKLNSIEDITVTSIPDHYPVNPGDKLASMRIVPLVTKKSNMELAKRLCSEHSIFELKPYKELNVGVVITGSEVYSGRIIDKFEPVVRSKMDKYPADILGVKICDDDLDMITGAAKELIDKGADLLIFTGGMSVDPDDLTPTAIRSLGAHIVSHGVPAQPGNMTLVAYGESDKEITMLGVPGAAIKMPATVFDVLLPQIFTGEPITQEDLIRLGDGGLCHNCESCHFPNCTFGRY